MGRSVTFRRYQTADYDQVAALWTRVNRELAPSDMRELFERYIAMSINSELKQLPAIFAEANRSDFWVVESEHGVVGTFGIERHSGDVTELRRMYLDRDYRGRGLAPKMLSHAEARASELGFSKMIVSTAEVQNAALRFYQNSGFRHVRTELATTMSAKQAGGGLKRFHFVKLL
jgi:N-acetylglutamate synthase-like GNAT family acetyltransferase